MEVEVHNSFTGPEDGVLDASAEEAVQELDNIALDAAEDIDPATTGGPEYDVPPVEDEPPHDVPPVENGTDYDVPPVESEPGDADVMPPPPTETPPPPPPEEQPPPPPAELEPDATADAITDTDSPRELADDEAMDPDYVNADVTVTNAPDDIDGGVVVAGDEGGTPPPVYAEDAAAEKPANANLMANGDTDEIIELHEPASNGGPKGDVEPILGRSEDKPLIKGKSFTICFIMFFFVIALTAVGLAFYFVISSEQANDTSQGDMITTSSPP